MLRSRSGLEEHVESFEPMLVKMRILFIGRLLTFCKFASQEVGDHEAVKKSINELPPYRKAWAKISLDRMVVEREVDFRHFAL